MAIQALTLNHNDRSNKIYKQTFEKDLFKFAHPILNELYVNMMNKQKLSLSIGF